MNKIRPPGTRWIAKSTRHRIYNRDNWTCLYCGFTPGFNIETIVFGNLLSLDHLKARCNGGHNYPTNLITACHKCNSKRGNLSIRDFLTKHFQSRQIKVLQRIKNAVRRKLK